MDSGASVFLERGKEGRADNLTVFRPPARRTSARQRACLDCAKSERERVGDYSKYDFHPYTLMFPMLPHEEFEQFKADIKTNGQREPIVRRRVSSGKYEIIDGRHRLMACVQLGVTPKFREYGSDPSDGDGSKESVARFIRSKNIIRRHLAFLFADGALGESEINVLGRVH